MRKIYLASLFLFVIPCMTFGQCPTAAFNLPDSVCAGDPFIIPNGSSGGVSYTWDLCPGELNNMGTGIDLDNSSLGAPQQLKLISQNGNYFLFVANFLSSTIVRYDFGTSLDNTPTVHDYGNMGGVINQPTGLDIVNENGTWYGLVASYGLNNIVRVDFGSDISLNTANGTNLGAFGLNNPISLKIFKENSDYLVFVSNNTGTDLTRITFNGSISNAPSGFVALNDANFEAGWGFDAKYDCSVGKWIGFYASFNLGKVNVIDFGNSLSNSGTITGSITIGNPTGVMLTREGSKWYAFVVSIGSSNLLIYEIEGSLLNTPVQLPPSPLGITSPRGVAVFKDSVDTKVFVSMMNNSGLKKITYSKPCNAIPPTSTDSISINPILFSVGNYQTIILEAIGPNGEITTFTDSVYVQETPLAGFYTGLTCEGQSVQFTDTSLVDSAFVTTWQWDFGDGSPLSNDQNPLHAFTGTGTFPVTLTTSYAGGCSNSVTQNITIYPRPEAGFTFLNNQCNNLPVVFTDTSVALGGTQLVAWQWDFGDGLPPDSIQHPIHSFSSSGTFQVTLITTTNTGCIDTVTQTINVLPAPVATFEVTNTCVGDSTLFNNTTTIQGSIPLFFDWNFGDSGTSQATHPSYQYANLSGNYLVTLIATAGNGCTDSISDSIRISNQPVPQFSWTPQIVCKLNQVVFSNLSTGTGGDTISLNIWDFGDGSALSNDINPVHAFSDTGYFNITLTVVSPTYCDSSITQQLYVIPSPTATFTANDVCLGLTTSFNPSTTTPPGTVIDSIVWTFGDGFGFSGLSSPSHDYINPGTYEVTMTVYNDLLCTAVFTDSIDVYSLPVADFSTSILCTDSSATFDGTLSSVSNDTITGWLWNFAGMGTANGANVSFTFPDSGSFNVTMIATTIHGCSDTIQKPVTVIQSPEFDFTFNEPCFGIASNFTYIPNVFPAPTSTLLWDFGDGTSSAWLSPSHTYSTIDTFMVSLTVQHDSTGCATTIVKPFIVKPYPSAGFSFTNNCENVPVQLTDTSTILSGSITGWNWNLGTLGSSTVQNPVVTPPAGGSYPVTLTVTSDHGCMASVSAVLTAYSNPEAVFTPDPSFGSPPLTVNFTNQSTGAIQYAWTFGDGSSGTGPNPSHIYQDTGLYSVSVVATSAEGCTDIAYGTVMVVIPYLDLAVNKVFASLTNNLVGLTAELVNMGNIPITTFQVAGIIENGSLINESWNGLLMPGNSMLYEFEARYDINVREFPGYYCIEALLPNNLTDQNPSNNSKCAVLSNTFEIYAAYPNPFNNELSVGFNLPIEDIFEIRIFDAAGKLVLELTGQQGVQGYNRINLGTSGFAKGIYALTIRFREELKVIKLMNY